MASKKATTSAVIKEDQIKVIEDPVEAVRKLPDVYIGALGNAGFVNMFREIFQNCTDIILKGYTNDYGIIVSIDFRSYTCILEDNGPGIPLEMLEKVFSVLHSSSNYDKKSGSGNYSSGKNGMGATITNFLSKFFVVESFREDGTAGKVVFNNGKIDKNHLQPIQCPPGKHGLRTSFCPAEMMGNITITPQDIYELIWQIVHLCKPGTSVIYNVVDFNGMKSQSIITNKDGIFEMLPRICKKPLYEPMYFQYGDGNMDVEALVTYDIENMSDPVIMSYVNTCPTSGGTHIDGLLDSMVRYFRKYMNEIYLTNKKLTVNAQDIRTGLRAVISLKSITPLFTGQSKEIYSAVEAKPFVAGVTTSAIEEWCKKCPNDLQKLSKYLKDVCELRSKNDASKIKMANNYAVSSTSGLPAKYKKPNGKGPFELIIVEGDSALGGIENFRDKMIQGIYPVRGKIPNCMTTPPKTFFANECIAGLCHIYGYTSISPKLKFDPKIFKPVRVIIATDADTDGAHIRSLMLLFHIRYFPEIVEEGRIYCATPPLYGIMMNGKMRFFADNNEYVKFINDIFCKNYTIGDSKGNTLSKSELIHFLHRNMHYIELIKHICSTFAIDMKFLEFLLYNRNLPYAKLKSLIEKNNKFVEVYKHNGTTIIKGLINGSINTIFFNDMLLEECAPLIALIDQSDKYYTMNGTPATIFDIMYAFSNSEPSNIDRYKGLGEMEPEMLGISTILPGMGRTLKQYRVSDVQSEIQYLRDIQSDKSKFIAGIKVTKQDIM